MTLIIFAKLPKALARSYVLYGEDNRRDFFEIENPSIRAQALAVATRVDNFFLKQKENGEIELGRTRLLSNTFGANVCTDERFANQISISDCTGFLIAPDILVTAGHCYVERKQEIIDGGEEFCADQKWVFGFHEKMPFATENYRFNSDQVFACKKIIYAIQNDSADFALLKLTKAVPRVRPIILPGQLVEASELNELYILGHPTGLPLKYADNGHILFEVGNYFITNLDSFGGNSGSPVFSKKNHNLVGIMIKGKTDYRFVQDRLCHVPTQCEEDGTNCDNDFSRLEGEYVLNIDLIRPWLSLKSVSNQQQR